MDENERMQGTEGTETDSFMDGWEETTSAGEELEDGPQGTADPAGQGAAEAGGTAGAYHPRPNGTGPGRPGEEMPGQAGGQPQGDGPQGAVGPTDAEGEQQDSGDQVVRQEPPRTWTLNHLGQAVTASEADMVALAQKGLDYDRIRGEYDEAKPVMAMFREAAGKAGMDLKGYLAHIRAQVKQAEGLSEQEARRTVELEDREAVVAVQEEARRSQETAARQELAMRQAADARMQADLREFREVFPEAAQDPGSIPKEVWAEVRSGRSLVGAYARYHEVQARAAAQEEAQRAAAQRQNEENAARAVGSMRSAGAETASKDPFLEGWNE